MTNENNVIIICSVCEVESEVEKGTWALDKEMCYECYIEYQGG